MLTHLEIISTIYISNKYRGLLFPTPIPPITTNLETMLSKKLNQFFPPHTHQLLIFANHKSTAQYHNRKRAQTLRWTKSWRRANKKVAVDKQLTKKLVKKTTKVFKAFVGLSLDDLKQRQTDDFKRAQQQAAERAKKSGDKKEVKKSEVVAKSSIPKHVASRINKAQARK
jgi:hypothetical protein